MECAFFTKKNLDAAAVLANGELEMFRVVAVVVVV